MSRKFPRAAALCVVLFIGAFALQNPAAQAPPKNDADFLLKAYDTYAAMRASAPAPFQGKWSYLGPTNVSGRATDIAVAEKDGRRRIYVAYATSGVWKTDDDGATWQAVFEHQATTSIGDIAVAPSNPDIVYVGTGEANIFRASMAGAGVYKSTDAGRTWTHIGLTDSQTIGRVVVHPTDPNIVYVAASGHEWTDNETRGVFKTIDGGQTWSKIFYKSPRTGANDLVMDPRDPNVLYAAMWQRIRRKYSDPRVEPGYREGGVFKTTDAGKTWTDVGSGLPAAEFRGRIGIDISASKPDTLYALVDNYEIGRVAKPGENDAYGRPMPQGAGFIKGADVYRSDDGGKSWKQTSRFDDASINRLNNHSGTYGWVFSQIRVDPTNPEQIWIMGVPLSRSVDGGRTFQAVGGMHGDHHGLWIDPKNTSVIYNANDGGFYQTADAGKTWKFAVAAAGAHFYNIEVDTSNPVWAYGSIQDHGSRRGRIDLSKGRDAVPAVAFEGAPGGEGSHHAIDPTNPNIVYSHGFYGNFSRTDLGATGTGRATGIQPKPADANKPEWDELRAQWMAPFIISPHDSAIVYAGYQFVFRSKNRGDAWEKISPDLSYNDTAQMGVNPSAIPYQTVVQIAESPAKKDLMYIGSDDGRIHTTIDGGKEWTELTSHIPVKRWISRLVPSQFEAGTIYITQRGREDDDFGAYVWKSTDYGKTFTSIAANLPAGPVNVIREDPRNARVLYVGTDFGAFISTNGGATWNVLGSNLPSVQVADLQFHKRENIVVIGTYGRGMWVIDATAFAK